MGDFIQGHGLQCNEVQPREAAKWSRQQKAIWVRPARLRHVPSRQPGIRCARDCVPAVSPGPTGGCHQHGLLQSHRRRPTRRLPGCPSAHQPTPRAPALSQGGMVFRKSTGWWAACIFWSELVGSSGFQQPLKNRLLLVVMRNWPVSFPQLLQFQPSGRLWPFASSFGLAILHRRRTLLLQLHRASTERPQFIS